MSARVVDIGPGSLIAEITGGEGKIDGLVKVLQPYGILEMVQTGMIAMTRGAESNAARAARDDANGATAA